MTARDGFTDKQGRTWLQDPTGRFTYRQIDGDRWTSLVCMMPRQEPGTDVEGETLSNGDHPELAGPAGRPAAALRSVGQSATWQYEVVTISADVDLESWLNDRGSHGWELVSVAGSTGGAWTAGGARTAIVKRPLPL